MSVDLHGKIPEKVKNILGCQSDEELDIGIFISTISSDGRPHFAMLSPFQTVISKTHSLYISLYSNSQTTKNLKERHKGTIAFTVPPSSFYMAADFSLVILSSFNNSLPDHSLFIGTMASVQEDYSQSAPIYSTVRFREDKIKESYSNERMKLCEAVEELEK
ncbi:MAG: hypothetical protein LVQ96_07220 [Thermoplasmatales archaeon]|nr:hypothetical protein [Thermoplasmatales archaeon]MCW6170946.1 hypothetical protein [Thermoplasmatales archaeon]